MEMQSYLHTGHQSIIENLNIRTIDVNEYTPSSTKKIMTIEYIQKDRQI